jgi:hypothetical protein
MLAVSLCPCSFGLLSDKVGRRSSVRLVILRILLAFDGRWKLQTTHWPNIQTENAAIILDERHYKSPVYIDRPCPPEPPMKCRKVGVPLLSNGRPKEAKLNAKPTGCGPMF